MATEAATLPAAAPATQQAQFWGRVHRWLRLLKAAVYVTITVFGLLVVAEVVRLYRLAADLHPIAGYVTALAIAGGVVLLAIPVYRFLRVPRAVTPPALPAAEAIRTGHLRAEVRFLERYLANCARNPEFASQLEIISRARDNLRGIRGRIARARLQEVSDELGRFTATTLTAILRPVDDRADRIINQEALAVGLTTAASPNGTLDAFVMLWRSLNLATKLAVLYYGRPGPLGTLAICRDVSVATVSAAYLQNVSDSLGGLVTRTVGGMAGMVAGPAVDGVTNALVLIRIGYLTRERCRSFRHWTPSAQRYALMRALAATQRVALGLTAEILRQVGSGIGAVAGAAVSGVSHAAGRARSAMSTAAGSAFQAAAGFGQRISSVFRGRPDPSSPAAEDAPAEDDRNER